MRQGDLNVKLPHLTPLFYLGHMLHPTLLHSNLAFHDLTDVSELIPALFGQALLMDEVVPFIIDVTGDEDGAALDQAKTEGAKGVSVLEGKGVWLHH
jgi:hypothetical protein